MMNLDTIIAGGVAEAVKSLYGAEAPEGGIQLSATRKEFEGDITLVTFPLLRISRQSPEVTAQAIGAYLKEKLPQIESYNVVKGFLNLKISASYWCDVFSQIAATADFGQGAPTGRTVMVEFSSPNTNKPLHLGHIRNNLLGWSVSRLLEAAGNKVIKVNLVNDRGIHICKSMLAWLRRGNGATPESSGIKGDHLVGDYYVEFNKMLVEETEAELRKAGIDPKEATDEQKAEAQKNTECQKAAQAMLLKWEQGDAEVRALWAKMNGWVYEGFDATYNNLGISFDKIYYESQTYLLGKSLVEDGLAKGVFYRREDGSVWCDLTADGLDEKLLLRSDGTSVYMTQDLGTACRRHEEYNFDEMIYVVGNEQNYHVQVLKLILGKLGFDWAGAIYHMSYGMGELPEGKMKSREGTVVDADDLIEKMYQTAKETSLESGKLEDMAPEEQDKLFMMLGLGALKYFIIKVDPKKTMLFDPRESIDFNGNTGPFIQYTHARIKSVLRKAAAQGMAPGITGAALLPKEVELIKILAGFPEKIQEAAEAHSPALVANYAYNLAKEFNQYYHDVSILKEENADVRAQRLQLISTIASVLVKAMDILGIRLPERM